MLEPVHLVHASTLGGVAREALGRARHGEVAALFEHSLYLRFDDDWLCSGERDIGRGPLNVLCDVPLPVARLKVSMPVRAAHRELRLGDAVTIDWSTARTWWSPPPPCWSPDSLRRGIAELDQLLAGAPPRAEGLGCFSAPGCLPATLVVRRAAPAVAALAAWIHDDADPARTAPAVTAVAGLLGLGPGLTPSGDDLLAGALVALQKLGRPRSVDALWQVIEPRLRTATHAISAAHLRAASRGECSALLATMVDALLRGDTNAVSLSWPHLCACEHGSTMDALAGVLVTLRSVLDAQACSMPATDSFAIKG